MDPSGKLWVLLHLPVFGSVSKSGPSKLGTIVSNNPAIADACVRTPALCIEGQALGSHEFTPPSQLCILELVVNVSGEVLQDVVRRRCDVLRIEMRHSSSYWMMKRICRHIPCRYCNQQTPEHCEISCHFPSFFSALAALCSFPNLHPFWFLSPSRKNSVSRTTLEKDDDAAKWTWWS